MSKLGIAVAAALALGAMGVAWSAWRSMADVEVGTAGTIAMVLGGLATLALGGGLVALLIISNRRGFDDAAGARPEAAQSEIAQSEIAQSDAERRERSD